MADVEEDDELETDELGIYREKLEDYSGSENGLMVDEDGIWQDDIDSYFQGGNDSGFCTAEQKSSSSLNKCFQDGGADGDEQTVPDSHRVQYRLENEEKTEEVDEEEELRRQDENSYNISELEASRSASVQGSQISCHPDMEDVNSDSRYPELAKGYFTSESELSKQGEGSAGRQGDSEYMAYYREEESYYMTNDEEGPSDRELFSESGNSPSPGSRNSYTRRGRSSTASDQRPSKSQTHQTENSRIPSHGNNRRTEGEQREERLLRNGHRKDTDALNHDNEMQQRRRKERQDEGEVTSPIRKEQHVTSMSQETVHSLAEFEQLEATLDEISSSGSEDVIGIYLRETEQWGIKDETAQRPGNKNRPSSSSVHNKAYDNKDNKRNGKVQDIPNRKQSTESHASSRNNERESRPPSDSGSVRASSRRAIHDGQKFPDPTNPINRSSERIELGRSQETRNLLQQTREALDKLNQERNENGHRDSQPASLQGSQIPILRSRSASLTRPGRHWSRSRQMSPSPSHSQSSLSTPQPLLPQESERRSSEAIKDSTVSDKRFSSNRKSIEATGGSDHSPAQMGRIDSIRSHGNSSSSASSRQATSATSQHQVQTSSAERSSSGFTLEEKEAVNHVTSQIIRNADDSRAQRGQNPAEQSSVASRQSKKSSAVANLNGASSVSLTNIDRHHSLYLTPSKSSVPPHLKMKRSNSLGGHNRLQQQPLRAVPGSLRSSSRDAISQRMAGTNGTEHVDFEEMYQAESQQHRMTVETYQQLQVGYLHLLKENAEIKNTVDSMRLGAEVRLISAAPTPVSVETGVLQPARHASVFTLSKMSTPSLSHIQREASVAEAGTVAAPQQATLSDISQDRGIQTVQSVVPPEFQRQMDDSAPASVAAKTFADAVAETSISLSEDVLSLSGRIKAAENRIKEFQRRSGEKAIDEKIQFLQRIKGAHAELEDEFDVDFVQEDGIYSSASRSKRNEIESQLVQLHLTINQLEDDVEATIKINEVSHTDIERESAQNHRTFHHTPSSVNDNAWNAAHSDSEANSFRHRGSVVSLAGNCDADDERLQDFNKTYTDLMDQYRRLKQLKSSSQRDDDITKTLSKLKTVYRQIPEHRKPALPAELENQYNPMKGTFVDTNSEHEEKKHNGLRAYESLQESSTSAEASTVIIDSDQSSGSKPDSVKRYLTSERQSKEQSSASQSNVSGNSQSSLQRNAMPPSSQAKDVVSSRSRDHSAPSERPRHGYRRLPKSASKSQSQTASQQDEFGNGHHKLSGSGSKRSTHHKPPLQSDSQVNGRTKASGSQAKTAHGMIRTSAHTPPGQSYSDTESDRTDDTVEEIFKQKHRQGRDQSGDSIDGFTQSQTKDENRRTALVGSTDGELDGVVSHTEDEINPLATKRADRRDDRAESVHLQKFTEVQQHQMPQPIPLHPSTTANPPLTFYVPSLQRLQNPFLQSVQQPGLQQHSFQQPTMHQMYVPTGTVPTGPTPVGIIPSHVVPGSHIASGNYFTRSGYMPQPHEQTRFLENGYGQSASTVHPQANYAAYQMNPGNDYLNNDRTRRQTTRTRHQHNGSEDRLRSNDRYDKSPRRNNRHSRKRHESKSQDDHPLPSVYFEPTSAQDAYPYLFTDANGLSSHRPAFIPNGVNPNNGDVFPIQYPYSSVNANNPYGNGVDTGVGSGLPTVYESLGIASRGIQNVPLMSTTGVQYMVDNGMNGPSYAGGTANTQHGTGNQPGLAGLIGQATADQPVVVTGASCPLCGRADYHTHTNSNLQMHNGLGYLPGSSNTQLGAVPVLPPGGQTLIQLPNGLTAFVGSSSNTLGLPYGSTALPSDMKGSLHAVPVPNQVLPTNVPSNPSRIRYYVREYDGQDTADDGSGTRYQKQSKQKPKSSKHQFSTDNDEDDDDEVDWALLRVVSTAKSLRKRSEDMTKSLLDELLLSFKDSTILQSF